MAIKPVLLLLSLLLFTAAPQAVQAQDVGSGLSIVPAITEKVVSAGQLTVLSITITNITDRPQAVAVSFSSFAPLDPVIDEQARRRFDASSWLSTRQPQILLGERESQSVDIRISPPSDAGAGGHYANAVFRVLGEAPGRDASSTAVRPELKALLFLTVPGDINELAEAEFVYPSRFSQTSPRQFQAIISGIGNVHLLPRASISIRRLNGQEVEKLALPPKLVIPGTEASLSAEWVDAPPGIYRSVLDISYGSPAKYISQSSGILIVLPSIWIQLLTVALAGTAAKYGLPPLFRRLLRRKVLLGHDLTGEPNIQLKRENIENADRMSRLKDASKRK